MNRVAGGTWLAASTLGWWTFAACPAASGFDFNEFETAAVDTLAALLAAVSAATRFVR